MAWLVTHMWMVLAGATVFALILGWSVRGILLTGRMRKAIVDKDVALTELDQARDEIERLFAAQRAQRGEGGSVADASSRKISDLTSELQKAKSELATLKTESAKAGSAGTSAPETRGESPTIVLPPNRGGPEDTQGDSEEAGATPAQDGGDEAEAPTLVWRNRHLEARVQHLESQLTAMEAAPAAAHESSGEAEPVVTAAAVPSADEAGLSKLKWQADYLKQRVEALEGELAKAPAEAPVVADEDANEEMARLRWRNRFLEGRLAYFEGGAEEAAAETVAETTGAEAMLEELEIEDTTADVTEAVEAIAEDISAADAPAEEEAEPEYDEMEDTEVEQAAFDALPETELGVEEEAEPADEDDAEDALAEAPEDDVAEEEAVEPEDDGFEDVSNDEEESLAEADHADEDVLSDEEYDADDFVEADDAEDDYDDEETDAQEESYDEGDDDSADDDVEDEFEDDAEDDEDGDLEEDEAYDDADDEDDAEDEYEADADDEDESDEDDEASDETWDEIDEAEADAEAPGDEPGEVDESAGEAQESYGSGETVPTERPMAMNGPVEGQPDDLTLVGGIGPKIQSLLNELGVWHYDQIAEWTPENVAWVDEHLNFNGRIVREGWVEQAAVLVRDAENA